MAIIDNAVRTYKDLHSIKKTAHALHIGEQKARKLLITAGVIQPEKSRQAILYLSRGLKIEEVAAKLGISSHSVRAYLPYTRGAYNQTTRSANAEKLAAWRAKRRSSPPGDAD